MNGTMSILVIEDHQLMADMLKGYLSAFSGSMVLTVNFVSTLADAIAWLKIHTVDVSVLDINLPNCQGALSVIKLFANAPTVPIVVLTGDNASELEEKCIRNGAQDFIKKSEIALTMSVDEFVRRLWHAVLRASQKREVQKAFAPVVQKIEAEKRLCEEVAEKGVPVLKDGV